MKILFLNQAFYPDVVASSQHLADLAVALVELGHKVTVLTGRRAYDDSSVKFKRQENWRGVRIVRVGSTAFGKSARWRRMIDGFTFLLLTLLRAWTLPRPDIIVALTSPPMIGLGGLCLARLNRSRFVHWTLDLNPDEAIAAGWLDRDSLLASFLERISQVVLVGADRVIVLDPFMRARVLKKGVSEERISILPPWSHETDVRFDPVGRERFRMDHGLKEKFVVMYSGNHSPCHPLDTVLQAAIRLADDAEIVFCFVGGGSEFRKIQQFIGSPFSTCIQSCNSPRPNILCLPYQTRSKLSGSLSAADLHLVVMGNAFVGIVHPCKVYNILSIAAPVLYIGPHPSPIAEALAKNAEPWLPWALVEHDDIDALVAQIHRMRSLPRQAPVARPIPNVSAFSSQNIIPKFVAQLELLYKSSTASSIRAPQDTRTQTPV